MALDTRDKRGSSIGLGLLLILPLANADIDQGDRQQTAHSYRGILAAEPSAGIPGPGFGVAGKITNNGLGLIGALTNDGIGEVGTIQKGFGVAGKITNTGIGLVGKITNDGIGKKGDI